MSKFEESQLADEMVRAALPPEPQCAPKIEMSLTPDDLKRLHALPNMKPNLTLEVIGYLVIYAIAGKYDDVLIYRDHNDIMASYRSNAGRKFFMCAHWDEFNQKWGTHS